MIKPYFQDEFCTIYHADARDVVRELEPAEWGGLIKWNGWQTW